LSGVVLPVEVDSATLVQRLNQRGVGVRLFWTPLHQQPAYAPLVARHRQANLLASFEHSDALWRRVMPLPCSTHITADEIAKVHSELAAALRGTD
jgi:dTDP-4-amino-4,6-dideoxygalactose transaminase